MAYYLVSAKQRADLLDELKIKLSQKAFFNLRPFGKALSYGLENARTAGDRVVWEEEDYCSPPLKEERDAVLDRYFSDIKIEKVVKGEGWKRIKSLPYFYNDNLSSG